ncbi:hypothetical protein ES677_10050 [Bizionia gelidisalsuginis]|uniref:Uncharacterized protein n=2 Tax=Bizionia TaxID=283785 RepID=A0A8H2LF43_9FLAO|nr:MULTISPECIES: hypothetical protein [Bizionia]TYB76112.1 hypothetical protein ES676_06575 [Bizionia saleffrena]TYC11404.1 hypothetical protein ES677_10050 [Bizionia gelidisalsuginis]
MHKILKIVLLIIGVLSMVFLARIVGAGDEEVKELAANGDTSLLEPMTWIAYIILGITLALVLLFVVVNLFANTATLKNALIGVGAFLVVGLIAYFTASGVETPMQDGKMLSASGAKWVDTGLYMFYFLAVIAAGTMLITGINKMIK